MNIRTLKFKRNRETVRVLRIRNLRKLDCAIPIRNQDIKINIVLSSRHGWTRNRE